MTKRSPFSLLAALLMLLVLTACAPEYHIPEDSYPTLPSFPEEQTPLQQLEAAFAAAAKEESYVVSYGTVRKSGEETTEDTHSQTVSQAAPFDRSALYATVPVFPNNENFLQDFCRKPIQAIPSNTGTICYRLTDLSWSDADSLLYSQTAEVGFAPTTCIVSIDVDGEGRFCRLEAIMETETQSLTAFLCVTFPDSQRKECEVI